LVRELKIALAYGQKPARDSELTEEETYATLLALAEGMKDSHPRVAGLSILGLPLWLVQTSSSKSILLAPTKSAYAEFEFTENPTVGEMRKILRSGFSEPEEVPAAVDRLLETLGRIEKRTKRIPSLLDPSALVSAAGYVRSHSIEASHPMVEGSVASQDALSVSEEYQGLRDDISVRIKAMEELRSLAHERLGNQLAIIENIISTEERRYLQQFERMQESLERESKELKEKTDRQLYSLREKLTMDLRAKTAEFARSMHEIESVLTDLLEGTRASRTAITQRDEDVEGAASVFSDFAASLEEQTSAIPQALESVQSNSEELLKSAKRLREEYEEMRAGLESEYNEQIETKNARVESFRVEMEEKLENLRTIRTKVKAAIEKLEAALNDRIVQLQSEFLDVTRIALDNGDIQGIAPLTRLTIHCGIVRFTGESKSFMTPFLVPDERLDDTLRHEPISRSFDHWFLSNLEIWLKEDVSFAEAFEHATREGNILLDNNAAEALSDGLYRLQINQQLKDGTKGHLEALWNRYSGKCPKCGTDVEMTSEFCPKCGSAL
jgi:hypothetical protein